jgi:hypothetical protein
VSMAYDGQTSPVSLADVDRTQREVARYVQASCMTMEERWKKSHIKFTAFMDAEKKRPSIRSKDPNIKILGNWGSNQAANYDPNITKSKKAIKTPEIHALWTTTINDAKYAKYFLDNLALWKNHHVKFVAYIDAEKKRPSSTSENLVIKFLGNWGHTQGENYDSDITKSKYAMKTPEIHALWTTTINDSKYAKYFLDNLGLWKNHYVKFVAYMDAEEKRPSEGSKDPIIKFLGSWGSVQVNNYDSDITKSKNVMKTPEIHALWTKTINDDKYEEYFLDNLGLWKIQHAKYVAYIDAEKKRPSNGSKDPNIKILGTWGTLQAANYDPDITKSKNGMRTPEIHDIWTNTINDVKYAKYLLDNLALWKNHHVKFVAYIDVEKKRPPNGSKDPNIKILASWQSTQAANYDPNITKSKKVMKTPEIHALWTTTINDSKYAKYFLDNLGLWKIQHAKYVAYMDVEKKRPSNSSKDPIIKFLGSWWSVQGKNYDSDITKSKNVMKTPEIHALWTTTINDDKYAEYLLDSLEVWKFKHAKYVAYMDSEKKRPPRSSKDPVIKTLGNWGSSQVANYDPDITKSKNVMKTPEIHALWTKTLHDYSEYF